MRRRTFITTAAALAGGTYVGRTLHRRQKSWGSRPEEVNEPLPGDSLISTPGSQSTRAISIAAPPEKVWPWLLQIGQNRGGFYSFTRLENLLHLDIHNADEIHPEWQNLETGDSVRLADGMDLVALIITPPEALVLWGDSNAPDAPLEFNFTWAFILRSEGDGSRLIVRERYDWTSPKGALQVLPLSPIIFLMTWGMLRGIKQRAERSPG